MYTKFHPCFFSDLLIKSVIGHFIFPVIPIISQIGYTISLKLYPVTQTGAKSTRLYFIFR